LRCHPVPSMSRPCFSKGRRDVETTGHHMREFLKSFIRDESGAAGAEYALIMASVGAGIAIAGKDLAIAISLAINTVQGYL
jgi:pilus assembly protein Flp/PilA